MSTGCDQCNAVMINGVFCHEHGCPNRHNNLYFTCEGRCGRRLSKIQMGRFENVCDVCEAQADERGETDEYEPEED